MKKEIEKLIKDALKNLGIAEDIIFTVEHPEDFKNGDYSTNVAMTCAKNIAKNPRELAEKIKLELEKNKPTEIEKIEIAGPGFINFYLSREFFTENVEEHSLPMTFIPLSLISMRNADPVSLSAIDPSAAYADGFISLLERETREERQQGTLGNRID